MYFCSVSCDFSFFISNFIDLCPLPFFLNSLAKGLSILFIFSKNQLLVLLIFAIVFFVSISFFSALVFMISFLLLTLGFLCSSFSGCFKCRVRLFIWDFSCFLRWVWIAINFPLRTAFAASCRFWSIVFPFSFILRYFLISCLISALTHFI